MAINVTLQDYPTGNVDAVAKAIDRFRRELERKLGERADAALKAYQSAIESSADELSKDELRLAAEWSTAYDSARTAVFRDLGDVHDTYFEVRLI